MTLAAEYRQVCGNPGRSPHDWAGQKSHGGCDVLIIDYRPQDLTGDQGLVDALSNAFSADHLSLPVKFRRSGHLKRLPKNFRFSNGIREDEITVES